MLDDVDDEASCVVCLSEKKEICLFPCGAFCSVCVHFALKRCSRKLRGCVQFADVC